MNWQSFAPLAFLAPLALFWTQVKGFIASLFSFLVRNDSLPKNRGHILLHFLNKQCKQIKFGNSLYLQSWPYVISEDRCLNTLFETKGKYIFLYKKFFPILVTAVGPRINLWYINIFNLRGLLADFDKFYRDFYVREQNESTYYYIVKHRGTSGEASLRSSNHGNQGEPGKDPSSGYNEQSSLFLDDIHYAFLDTTPPLSLEINNLASHKPKTDNSAYYLSPIGKEVEKLVDTWLSSEKWYAERDIRWFRSILLHGVPGGGKSEMVKEIAKKFKLPLHIFDLSSMNNREFEGFLSDVTHRSLVLIEDLDSVFEGRLNITKTDHFTGLTFDCFINALSGAAAMKNCFLFITTNHKEKLDPALLRQGRLDKHIEVGYLDQEGKRFIASKMLDKWPEMIPHVISDENETAAEFSEKVTSIAVERFWEDKK